MNKIAYIASPSDPELQLAWAMIITQIGITDGWQYMGSEWKEDTWKHCFRRRESGNHVPRAYRRIKSSPGWLPANEKQVD
jgi:hypothetical protein